MAYSEDFAVKLAEVDQRGKSNTHRIDMLEKSTAALNELATAVKVMVTKQEYIAITVASLDKKVTELECKPGRRWDALVGVVVASLVTGIIGYMLAHFGV
jgi:hypothetical protein